MTIPATSLFGTIASNGTSIYRWEAQFTVWAQGPSQTEQEKCDRAATAIKKAILNDPTLSKRSVAVFAQGSYRNRTNIKLDSDVDVCVRCDDFFFADYPAGMTQESFGNITVDYTYKQFKNEVEIALVNYFGRAAVKRGNKAFDIHENSYRVDSDAIPTFQYRRYNLRSDGTHWIDYGVKLYPDNGGCIINWPEQNYQNGVTKRTNTKLRYKRIIRILKNLRNHMQSKGIPAAKNVASFLIECLAWNAPDSLYGNSRLSEDVEGILEWLSVQTSTDGLCQEWGEVNELKYLFRPAQPWTRQQANNFVVASLVYLRS